MQICGVAACTDKTVESCGKRNPINPDKPINPIIFDAISIKSDKFVSNSNLFPSYVDYTLDTTSHYYYNAVVNNTENKFKTIEMKSLVPVKNLLGFGIYGTVTINSAASSFGNFNVLLFTVIVGCFVVKFNYLS